MTIAVTAPPIGATRVARPPGLVRRLCDVAVLTGRNLVHIARSQRLSRL